MGVLSRLFRFSLIFIGFLTTHGNGQLEHYISLLNLKTYTKQILNTTSSIEDSYGAAMIMKSLFYDDVQQHHCNCKSLTQSLRNFKNSLDIYYGLKTMELCSCSEKYNDKMKMRVKKDIEVMEHISMYQILICIVLYGILWYYKLILFYFTL